MKSSLVDRVLTGVVAIPLVLGLFYLAHRFSLPWLVGILLSAVALVAGWEYLELVERLGICPPRELLLGATPLYLLLAGLWEGTYALVLGWGVAYLTVIYSFFRRGYREGFLTSLASIFGFIYIPGLLSFFYLLFRADLFLVYHFLFIVWGYDTGAFFAGTLFGKHQLLPRISLAKTWEGVVGGLILATVGAALYPRFLGDLGHWAPHILALGVSVGAFVQLGDLFESLLKRAAGVKDSGRIFPGHGGMLDRIDGILASIPVYYFYVRFILGLLP
ncbi:phosphatidate cytidylyltransferase [Candidatus Bipolaricaulota bacterium]|nr:phosphatidate cytidylyltransferase [Candidatus Bipolaricaulota bacterium]